MLKRTINYTNLSGKFIVLLFFVISSDICLLKVHSQSLLWKISRENTATTSYLYGTIHIKDKRVLEFSDSVLTAFEKCDAFAIEVDLNPENLVLLSQRMILPEDQTLMDLFAEEEYQLIKTVVQNIVGVDISLFNKLKPIALLSLVMNYQFANDVDVSVDEYFYRKATEENIKVIGIESIEEQLEILDSIPNDYIIEYFKNIDSAKEDMETIIELYRSADLDKMLEMMQKDKSMVMIRKNLLTDRNKKMTERIQPIINEQSTFIAIGAGHLPGNEGIINLLTKAGYIIKPVR
jgi:uncharacterized protein YbaP (TraB family)